MRDCDDRVIMSARLGDSAARDKVITHCWNERICAVAARSILKLPKYSSRFRKGTAYYRQALEDLEGSLSAALVSTIDSFLASDREPSNLGPYLMVALKRACERNLDDHYTANAPEQLDERAVAVDGGPASVKMSDESFTAIRDALSDTVDVQIADMIVADYSWQEIKAALNISEHELGKRRERIGRVYATAL